MDFNAWGTPLLGGVLIGLSASLVLVSYGRPAGISGLWAGLLQRKLSDRTFRTCFFLGLLGGGVLLAVARPQVFGDGVSGGLGIAVAAGLLVGYGTRLGSGCTSGHGVCGISRGERRSFAATGTFIFTGAVTVLLMRWWGLA